MCHTCNSENRDEMNDRIQEIWRETYKNNLLNLNLFFIFFYFSTLFCFFCIFLQIFQKLNITIRVYSYKTSWQFWSIIPLTLMYCIYSRVLHVWIKVKPLKSIHTRGMYIFLDVLKHNKGLLNLSYDILSTIL